MLQLRKIPEKRDTQYNSRNIPEFRAVAAVAVGRRRSSSSGFCSGFRVSASECLEYEGSGVKGVGFDSPTPTACLATTMRLHARLIEAIETVCGGASPSDLGGWFKVPCVAVLAPLSLRCIVLSSPS